MKTLIKTTLLFLFINSYCHSQHWEAATPFPGTDNNGMVTSMQTLNNELIVGGSYTSIGGIVAHSIARWNGVKWNNLGAPNLLNGSVSDMIIYNNKLFFMADILYVWDGIGLQAVTYSNGNQQLNISGYGYGDLHVFNGDLYIVGSSKLIKYNGVTANDIAINSPVNGSPRCLDDFNNNLYLGTDKGLFKYQNNTWIDVSGISNTPPNIIDIETYNNELYVLGSFSSIGGISVNNIAKYNGSSFSMTSFPDNSSQNIVTNPLLRNNLSVNHFNVINNELYLAHYFIGSTGLGQKFSPLIKFNGTNWIQLALNYPTTEGGLCSHMYNNSLFCGGYFRWFNDVNNIADMYNNKIGGIAKLNNTLSINDISIDKQNTYPNPTSSEVKITLTHDQLGKSFKLFDNIGREKMSGVFNSTEYTFNLESFEPGIYFLKIAEEDAQIKIVKN